MLMSEQVNIAVMRLEPAVCYHSIIITEQKSISDCYINFVGASSCDLFIPPSIDIHELILIGSGGQVLNT